MMVKQGDSRTNDRIRADLTRDHPAIQIEDTPQFYDILSLTAVRKPGTSF